MPGPRAAGKRGGTSQRRRRWARGHRQPRPAEPQTGHSQASGDSASGGHGGARDARDVRWVSREAAGTKPGTGCPWVLLGTGTRTGWQLDGSRRLGKARGGTRGPRPPRPDQGALRGHAGGTGAALGDNLSWGCAERWSGGGTDGRCPNAPPLARSDGRSAGGARASTPPSTSRAPRRPTGASRR